VVFFDDRKKAFEERFRYEQDLRFKITARGNWLFGEWAAARLGMRETEAGDYAKAIVDAQFEEPGVVARVSKDLSTKGIVTTEAALRSKLTHFRNEAKRQIMAE
jgi:hypothetical protein